ncbi:MAG: phosphate ABC transporter permease PstA [Gloeobacterales cyanobacterium]
MMSTGSPNKSGLAEELDQPLSFGRAFFDKGMTVLSITFTLIALVPLFSVLYYVLVNGFSSLNWTVLTSLPAPTGSIGGFGNAIQGSFIIVALATALSVPIGVLTGIYLSEYGRDNVLDDFIRFGVNVLSGVPSIIVGVFAYGVLVIPLKTPSAYAGAFALAILMLPIIVRTTEEALKLISWELRLASLGLGANRFQTIARVIVPAAFPGIITGILLGISRAAGETAPLIFTAASSTYWFSSPTLPTASLATLIFSYATSAYNDLKSQAWAASLLLLLLVLTINILARYVFRRRF